MLQAPLETLKKMDFNSILSTVNTSLEFLEGFVGWDRTFALHRLAFGYGKCDIIFLDGRYHVIGASSTNAGGSLSISYDVRFCLPKASF